MVTRAITAAAIGINACKIDPTEMTQTSAIRLSAHHKPHPNMGKLRP